MVSIVPGGPGGPGVPGGLFPERGCLSILGLLGTLGTGALARALALFSIWRVANSRLATWEAIMVEAV